MNRNLISVVTFLNWVFSPFTFHVKRIKPCGLSLNIVPSPTVCYRVTRLDRT